MSLTESRAHFGLWASMAAPLIAGTDVVNIAKENLDILTNPEVIAIDQDPLGVQAKVQATDGSTRWTLVKPLANGDTAVTFFNAGAAPLTMSVGLGELGLDATQTYSVRDLWAHTTSTATGTLTAEVPSHGVQMFRIAGGTASSAAPYR
jgi:hypothetical protein